jgi:peptidoglycan/LPS O-acetylase OafA/YrhL
MLPLQLPTFHWQKQSQLSEDTMQSLLISLLRGLAALQVAAAHLRAEAFPGLRTLEDPSLAYVGLAFITGFAHQAVIIFFLISGWLVGGSLLNKIGQPQALRSYTIDRVTRLWTVLVPTFVLILLIGFVIGAANPARVDFSAANPYSATAFVGNMLGLQTVTVPSYGGNFPLWSLAYETWYYVQFPLLLLVFTGPGILRQVAGAAALALIVAALPYMISLYFLIWLLGTAFSRVRVECGNGWRIALLLVTLCLSVYYRIYGNNDDLVPASFVQDLICSLPFLVLLSSMHMRVDPASRHMKRVGTVGKFFSEFSFTLYVVHVPIIILLSHIGRTAFGRDKLRPDAPVDFLLYFAVLVVLVLLAYLFYLMFERHTFKIRRLLKSVLLQRGPKDNRVAALSTK